MVIAWLLFPLLLGALTYGCGLLTAWLARTELPWALILPLGLVTLIVAAQFATTFEATAQLAGPLVVLLALAGFVVTRGGRTEALPSAAELASAAAVFAVFAAPVVLLGEATVAGYLKLEDGSTFLALVDSALERGRGLDGFTESGYPIIYNRGDYPVGSLLPFGVGGRLLGEEIAWLFQPYLAFLAAILALTLQALAAPLIASPWMRALVAFVAAQAALLFGFAMWGGVKELTAAFLIPLVAVLLPYAARGASWRAQLPLAVATAAAMSSLSFGAVAWLGVPFALTLVALARAESVRVAAKRTATFLAVAVPLLVPALPTAGIVTQPGSRGVLTNQNELATLYEPLNLLQAAGVWLTSDFRLTPDPGLLTLALIVLVLGAAVAGAWEFRRGKDRAALLYTAGAVTGGLAIVSQASPWVDAKALATIAPLPVFLAMSAGAHATETGRRLAGWCVIGLVAAGVLASNALAYREVTLAPRDRFEELAEIDRVFAGKGPTLLTRADVYANRYFLRNLAVDNAAELRWHRTIRLRDGRPIPRMRSVDIDRLSPETVGQFRLLVLRRSPVASRPPSSFELAWRGRWYDVWRRARPMPVARLALGSKLDAGDTPRCTTLRRFADRHDGLELAAARAPDAVVVRLPATRLPSGWRAAEHFPGGVLASRSGTVETDFELPHEGRWQVWVGGAVVGHVSLEIDGRPVAGIRHRLNRPAEYERAARVMLAPGRHRLEFAYNERLVAGINDRYVMGPVALTPEEVQTEPIRVRSRNPGSLCNRRLDWVEAVQG